MPEVTIEELCAAGALAVGDGYRTKRSEHGEPGYRILRVADVDNGSVRLDGSDFVRKDFLSAIGSKLSEAGDVLLTTKGTVGRVAIFPDVKERVAYSPQLCYFRVLDRRRLVPRYLAYWFQSEDFKRQASHRANNTDMAAYINLKDIRSLQLSLPSLGRQRAIAEVLGALDDKIVANEQVVSAATSLAVTLAGTALEGVPVSDLARHATAQLSPGKFDEVVVHYSLPAFDAGNRPEGSSRTSIKSNKFLLERPVVLVSKLNPRIPRVWDVVDLPERMAVASTEFVVLEPVGMSTTALWASLSQPAVATELAGNVAGTSGSHQRVRPADVLSLQVPDPRTLAPGVQSRIDAIGVHVHHLRIQNERLAATRDQLVPPLMSGRLWVEDAERTVEGVV